MWLLWEGQRLFHWVELSSYSGSRGCFRNDPERKQRGAKDAKALIGFW